MDNTEDLKKEINNLIWMYGPGNITLEKAEYISCQILAMIKNGYNVTEYSASLLN